MIIEIITVVVKDIRFEEILVYDKEKKTVDNGCKSGISGAPLAACISVARYNYLSPSFVAPELNPQNVGENIPGRFQQGHSLRESIYTREFSYLTLQTWRTTSETK